MAEPSTGAVVSVGLVSLAGILTSTPFGMSSTTILLATGFTMLGVFGRLGYEISKSAETPQGVNWAKVGALFGGSMISATCIAVLYLAVLSLAKVQNESVLIFGLIFLGFSGPKGFIWLFNTASAAVTRLTGFKLPQFPVGGDSNEQEPPK